MLNGEMIAVDTIVEYLDCDLLGVVPDDDAISTQLLIGGSVNIGSPAYKSFYMVTEKLHNGTNVVFDCTKKYRGVVGHIRKSLRRMV